jgi:hypothetical protein
MIQRMSKARLIKRILRSRGELEALVDSLTPAELGEITSPDGWTVKDHLAHLAVWEAGTVAMLGKQPRFAAMGLNPAFVATNSEEEINQRIFELNREKTAAEVLEYFQQVHGQMMETLNALSEEELYHTYSYFQPDDPGEDRGIPVIEWVKGNTYDHFDSHVEWIRKLIGR